MPTRWFNRQTTRSPLQPTSRSRIGQHARPGKKRTQQWQALTLSPALVRAALCLAILMLAAAGPSAHAVEVPTCALPPEPPSQASAPLALAGLAGPAAEVQRMLAQWPACQKDAVFLAALGQWLNRQERYLEAADHLERALMLDPDLKDAQLSYAIALTGSGDVISAQALLDNLLSDATLPAALRPLIARQKALLANRGVAANPYAWQKRFTLATRIGHDSNPLGTPNLSSLALTLPGQTIVLPLDDNYLARPAGYARADAQLELSRTAPDGARWDALASLRGRYSPAIATAGSTQVDLLIERSTITSGQAPSQASRQSASQVPPADSLPGTPQPNTPQHDTVTRTPASSSGSYFNASASALHSNSGTRFMAGGLGGGLGTAWRSAALATCQSRAGLELQERRYLDNEVLSGRYTGLSFTGSCENQNGVQLLLGLKAGRDHANDATRPGGSQQQASLRFATFLPQTLLMFDTPLSSLPNPASRLRNGFLLDIEHSQQQDSSSYSPIIDSGRSRKMLRTAARVEYQYSFSSAVQGVLGAEWVGQTSNIELFRLNSRGLYSGLRLGW